MSNPTTTATMDPERRVALIARLAAGKANRAIQGNVPRPPAPEFADMSEWERLASEAGLILPRFDTPLTTAGMERWLRRLGIPLRDYYRWNGAGLDGNDGSARLADFITRNPTWTMRAWVGCCLENRHVMGDAA